ncbi:Do family serine endopeptidase [Mesorhizobium sp. NBSH29]|uniref:DegQ family serine endoprotease n=1 Tax=Mesorhizobium sp. NBSH29 TaxID=2654249 RepID=UPI0018967D62|nr:DegQ family serine endoprotease [Mesorhizobium sp. NBSH29]QPC88726.1 Do family serine endopeptidase [Mesorhizobium sp. NBSH29]
MPFFHARSIAIATVLTAAVLGAALPGHAQDSSAKGLGEVLSDFLRGKKSEEVPVAPAPASPAPMAPQPAGPVAESKRLPFSRDEVQLSFAPLVKETAPAVVNVYASQQVRARSPFQGDPFFERFFGDQMPPRVQSSLGSGVLVDSSGLVVTNFHVIRDADEVKVATADGREFESKVLLKDESLDLAVLKIEAKEPFPALSIGDSDALEVGDLVLAIGNPFGVGQTTTSGIVSALARSHIGVSDFGFFIQTDAAINPGNSGGALVAMGGKLIGINTAIYSRSGGSIGIGFAIPSNIVRAVVDSARNGSDYFERPFIGAGFEAVTAQIAEALGLGRPQGALVASVIADGPAAKGGLKAGDVILAMNTIPIEHVDALGYRLATQAIGSSVEFKVLSGGAEKILTVGLIRAPEGETPAQVSIDGSSPFAGTTVALLSPRLSQKLRMPDQVTGVVVVGIKRNSPAARSGFMPRDIVREVNGTTIKTADDLVKAAAEESRWWRFTVEREGRLMRQVLRY